MRSNSRSSLSAGLVCILGLVLAACSNDPYRVEAPKKAYAYIETNLLDESEKPRDHPWDPIRMTQPVSLCYSSQLNTPDQVEEVAKEICKGGSVGYLDQDFFWNGCGLFQPHRATFICRPGKAQGATN